MMLKEQMMRKYFTGLKLIVLLSVLSFLSSCSVYSGGFNCPDSRGASCTMLSRVDRMIDSGEIETVYRNNSKGSNKRNNKCRGKCDAASENVPKLAGGNGN